MRRYWRIYKTFAKTSFQRELEFRANFFAKVLQNIVWTAFFLVVLLVIYSKTQSIGGWSQGEALMLAGTIFILDAVIRGFFWSVIEIPANVRMGTLDFVVTKPVDSQFWVSTRKFDFGLLGALVTGFVVTGIGASMAGANVSASDLCAYLVLLASANAIFYGLNFAMMTLGIYFVRVDNLWVLSDTMMGVSRFPIDIYSFLVQKVFTYGLPLAFLAHYPASQLKYGADWPVVALGVLWAVAIVGLGRLFWSKAMTSYGSASS